MIAHLALCLPCGTYVLLVHVKAKRQNANFLRLQVEWREYSFLNNPALPKSVKDSRLSVEVCAPDKQEGCNDGAAPAPVKVMIHKGFTLDPSCYNFLPIDYVGYM
jgi:hypothetical protein